MNRPMSSGQRRGGSDRGPRLSRKHLADHLITSGRRGYWIAIKGRAKCSQAWMRVVSTFRAGPPRDPDPENHNLFSLLADEQAQAALRLLPLIESSSMRNRCSITTYAESPWSGRSLCSRLE